MSTRSNELFPGVPLHVVKRELARENARFGPDLQRIPREQWPPRQHPDLIEVWRSRNWLVQVFDERERGAVVRVTVSRTTIGDDRRWRDGITWDELMSIKRIVGFGTCCAVEVYPADVDVVNVANMRHLWILDAAPVYAWKKGEVP